MNRQDTEKRLRNLREKIVDRNVFAADEALELIDLLLDSLGVESGAPPVPVTPPPDGGNVGGTTVQ